MALLSELFYAGRYTDIVATYIDTATSSVITAPDAVYIAGALSFLGRTSEADAVLQSYAKKMTPPQVLEAKMYLVFALRRQRRKISSQQAKTLIIEMARQMRSETDPDDRTKFFFYVSLAFYRYVDARFNISLAWSKKAYDHAFRSVFPFGRLLAYDLMGHCQLNSGDVRAGMRNLNNSAAIAESLGRGAIRQATDVTLRLYRSTFGLDHAKILYDELSGAVRACSFENSYTLANLLLEFSRLQILTGDGHLAEKSLREAGEWIYRLDMPFLDANLSFRYACVAHLKGDSEKALQLLRSASARVAEASDTVMELRILGLQQVILHELKRTAEADELSHQLKRLEQRSGSLIGRRIHARRGISSMTLLKRGEDMLGDLVDDISSKSADARAQVLKSGFHGLIPGLVDLRIFSEAILFSFVRDSVTVIAGGQVRHDPDGWPDLVRKLFLSLGEHRTLTKEDIAQNVWRQAYSPLRHDPLIYALVARARKMLEPNDDWLTVSDGSYTLAPSVVIRDVTLAVPLSAGSPSENANVPNKHPDLSLRQSRILALCERTGIVTNKDICESFKVSEVTAGRDLAELVDKGHLERIGKGRATSYTKP